MQDVVLVEELDTPRGAAGDLTDPEAPSSTEPTAELLARGGPTWLLRTRATWSPIAAGLALVVGTSGLVAAGQERERMAGLAGVPGILRPLDLPLAELWRTRSDTTLMYVSGLTGFRGRLLLTENFTDGRVDVVALDARTGQQDWRVEARPAPAAAADTVGASASGAGASCAFPVSADSERSPVVACVVTDETASITSDNDMIGEMIVGTRAHLLVIDAITGAVVSQTPTDPTSSLALLGPDILTGQFTPDGRVQVSRSGARDGTLAWMFTSPDPVSTDTSGQRNLWVWASEGVISVSSFGAMGADGRPLGRSSWLLSPDGAVVRQQASGEGDDFAGLGVLPGGSTFVESTTTATGGRASVLTDAVTGSAVTVEAAPAGARPDDGSLGDAILMQSATGGALLVYDLATGRPRWTGTATADGNGSSMVLDGRVVHSEFDGTSSVDLTSADARTGETVWSTSMTSSQSVSLVSDGRVVLVSRSAATTGLGGVITAYDLADGRRRWELPIDEEQWLLEIDGGLFGLSGPGLIVAYGES